MRKLFLIWAVMLGFSQLASAHPGKSRVEVELSDAGPVNAGTFNLQFQLLDLKDKKLLLINA